MPKRENVWGVQSNLCTIGKCACLDVQHLCACGSAAGFRKLHHHHHLLLLLSQMPLITNPVRTQLLITHHSSPSEHPVLVMLSELSGCLTACLFHQHCTF